jgi:sarcosine oxidase
MIEHSEDHVDRARQTDDMGRSPQTAEFVVVGAGLVGLATACSLTARGHDVVVLETATVGHLGAGSKGATRVFRRGYDDALYVRMAMAAQPLWADLERVSGRALLTPTDQVSFAPDLGPLEDAMRAAGAQVERMARADAQRRFPAFAVSGDALFEPDSAVIDAAETLAALRSQLGARVVEGARVRALVESGGGVTVEAGEQSVDAAVVVVCAGPHTAQLVPIAPTVATLEHLAYFRPTSGALPPMPIFIEHTDHAVYGLPTPSLGAYKLAFHHGGHAIDPDRSSREPQPAAIDALREAARRWLRGFDSEPVAVETCIYDNTPSADFVLDRRGRIVVGAGTSGHGFKFGPLFGEILADLATDRTPAFPVDRFAASWRIP